MQRPFQRWFVPAVCLFSSLAALDPAALAQTAVPPDGLPPEEWVPVDPVPPGNEMRQPTTPGQPLTPPPPSNPPPPPPPPSTAELLDYDAAFDRLGDRMPRGSAVALGIVEGDPGAYAPDPEHPAMRGLPLTPHSGPSNPSGHALTVMQTLAGRRGLVPDPKAVGSWSVQHWMSSGFLQLGTSRPPRLDPDLGQDTPRVWSHSWIGTDAARALPVLRRIDFAIDSDAVVMCVGVNNGKESTVPPMLGSAYNVIAVGVDDGNSSGGFTNVEGNGRCKPDVVAPGNMTSFSTPAVAGVAALLIDFAETQHADDPPTRQRATRPETVKAAIMAGAQKHHRWQPLPQRPLDERLGAGRVNLDASLRIIEGGPIEPGHRITRGKAWAFAELPPRATHRFILEAPRDLGEFSVVLTWHRRIDGRSLALENDTAADARALWHHEPRLADLDLRLLRVDDKGRTMSEYLVSASRIDNVEHLYLPALPAGRYALEVVRDAAADPMKDEPWTYALAWRLEPPRP